jgi:multidrug efflux pump
MVVVQAAVFGVGFYLFAPPTLAILADTSFQAPSLLKLAIEITVFGLEMMLKGIGIILVLLLPTWIGLIYLMAKRSREGYFVDVVPEGVAIGMPADRYFLAKGDITRIETARFFPSIPTIRIHSGRQRIIVRKLVKACETPEKKPLWAWLAAKAPDRAAIRQDMLDLKDALDKLIHHRSSGTT